MKKLILISLLALFSQCVLSQIGISKSQIEKGFNSIRSNANYPDTWSMKNYAIYENGRDRKCIDVAIIEVKSLNYYGVPIYSSYLSYFINGRLFYYLETKYTVSIIQMFTEEGVNGLIETAIEGGLNNYLLTKQELCKSKSEEEKERQEIIQKNISEKIEKERNEKREKERNAIMLETSNVVKKLDSLIDKKNYIVAADLFIQKNGKVDVESFRSKIYNGLVLFYKKDTVIISQDLSNKIIEKNKEQLLKYKDGKYSDYININGEFKINNVLKIDKYLLPSFTLGNNSIKNLKIGDAYSGGIIIKISENEIIITSPKPIGSGPFNYSENLCADYNLNGRQWRLPSPEELKSIFLCKDKLESYENNWYWTNNEKGSNAEHIGLRNGDRNFVPKEHGKWIFAVTSIPINYFEIPLNSCFEFVVNDNKDFLINTVYSSSVTKPVFQLTEDNFCFKSKDTINLLKFNYDANIMKNTIREEKRFESTRKVNNIIILREEKKVIKDYIIMKKC
jgi:hypothetical protein